MSWFSCCYPIDNYIEEPIEYIIIAVELSIYTDVIKHNHYLSTTCSNK